jgi:ABC-type transporter Mla MlaB component
MDDRVPEILEFAVRGPIASRRSTSRCDVDGVEPDAVTVDALARLQLAAQRHGCRVHLCNASAALLELVDFMGLTDVLPG